jgi:hypothetical protein
MYRAVSAAVIFDTLWSLISFGHRKLHNPLSRRANVQLPVHLYQAEIALLMLYMISSESDWSVPYSILVDHVSIGDL